MHVVRRSDGPLDRRETNVNFPADVRPVRARRAKLDGLRAFVTIRLGDADGADKRALKAEDDVARRDLAHELVEGIAGFVSVALGRPELAAGDFVAVSVVLVEYASSAIVGLSYAQKSAEPLTTLRQARSTIQ